MKQHTLKKLLKRCSVGMASINIVSRTKKKLLCATNVNYLKRVLPFLIVFCCLLFFYEILLSDNIWCITFEPGRPYVTLRFGYVTKNDFMWVQLVHSKGDLRSVLKCEGVRVGDFEGRSTYLMGCAKKRFFLNRMELHFNPDEIKILNFFVPESGLIELVEMEDRIVVRNLGPGASEYPYANAEVPRSQPRPATMVPFGGQ